MKKYLYVYGTLPVHTSCMLFVYLKEVLLFQSSK